MPQEMEHPREPIKLGDIVAQQLRGLSNTVPPEELVTSQLTEMLRDVQARDQESNDAIAEYIRNCSDWSYRTKDGYHNLHYYLDTHIANPDGSVTYIWIDHTMQKTEAEVRDAYYSDEEIRQMMFARYAVDDQTVADFVVGSAKSATLRILSPEAMDYLRNDAVDGTSMLDLARLTYNRRPTVQSADETEAPSTREDDILRNEITHSVVLLDGKIEMFDVSKLLRGARLGAIDDFVESVVHVDEWRELYNRSQHDTKLSESEVQAMLERMQQIEDENECPGPESGINPGIYLLQRADEYRDEVILEAYPAWNQEVFEELLKDVTGLGLYLESEAVGIRIIAAQGVRRHALAQQAFRAAIPSESPESTSTVR